MFSKAMAAEGIQVEGAMEEVLLAATVEVLLMEGVMAEAILAEGVKVDMGQLNVDLKDMVNVGHQCVVLKDMV